MPRSAPRRAPALAAAFGALLMAGCVPMSGQSSGLGSVAANSDCEETDSVRVVLQWVAQAQFAGYYHALDSGFYADQCLDVQIQEGGTNVVPQQVLAAGNAEFAVSHVTKTMATREQGADLVNIGQVFQRGAYLQVSRAESGIGGLDDLAGTRLGSWGSGNELVLYAALRDAGIDPEHDLDVVQQPFDMSLLLNGEVDSAQAKTYNEYAQLLETENPETGELYRPEDFHVINLQDEGYASLEDGVYARGDWLDDPDHRDVATRFLAATYRGWIACRDDFDACADTVLAHGSALGEGHQRWMLNEVNKLIWPAANGIGTLDAETWDQTIEIAVDAGVLESEPPESAYRGDLTRDALALLGETGADTTGETWEPERITVTPGGR
ncbi:ABC transporter substrate-binding protein [Streptomyces sp. MP131-18]|uniref:ABC transporter substrate-binding protein n=1 Tax=Streptomyces sp. MP131-18 TaxID=1857892 RepID=UPI00097BC8B6|nr:ABC transporter substrate-binding protein [Streptomyces sp. MP131-18]ONK10220.1 putative thiamine biosynthesis protein [Streptomyces sp. MP131-18]